MHYRHISDLPSPWTDLVDSRLSTLAEVWSENYKKVKKNKDIVEFNEQLARRWSVETGIIEGLYSLDRGTTELLITEGFKRSLITHGAANKSNDEVIALLIDQKNVIDGLFDFIAKRRDLSISFIKELHQQFTTSQNYVTVRDQFGKLQNIPLKKGDWKDCPNNPVREDGTVYEYCPPEHVAQEMDNLIRWHVNHEQSAIPPEIEAAWLHHRFTQIHPFQDGNGRVARALASLIFIKSGLFPLVVTRDERDEYIDALEQADAGYLSHLVSLFSKLQQKQIIKALSISSSLIDRKEPIKHILASAKEKLQKRLKNNYPYQKVYEIAERLHHVASKKITKISDDIEKSMGDHVSVDIFNSSSETNYWFRQQVISLAKLYDYFADTETYHTWARLRIRAKKQTDIVFSFHILGTSFVGIMAVSAFVEHREKDEEDISVVIDGPHMLTKNIFQFTYKDNIESVEKNFSSWVDDAVVVGLESWRKQL